jgi:hypothetical protein
MQIENGGKAGDIIIKTDLLDVRNGAVIQPATFGSGDAGSIDITAKTLNISGSGVIAAATFGSGNGGSILATADSVHVDGEFSGLQAVSTGDGAAGSVTLHLSDSLIMTGKSALRVFSTQGDGGDINVTAGRDIRLTNSGMTAEAAQNGGNINLVAGSLIYLLHSPLTANAHLGNGGNITFDPSFVILNLSPITAKVDVAGNGGKVTINSDFFFASRSPFDVSTPSGIPGSVVVTAPDVDLSASLVALPAALQDSSAQLPEDCAVRLPGGISSFIIFGRGGLPLEPGGFMPSGQ